MTIFYLILAVLLFVGLVVAHEWGHFIAARRGGVEVEEFGIGFPPKIWGKKVKTEKSKFLFTINALPLGGFVRLKGENDADRREGSFGAASTKTKVKVMTAGVLMNLIVAYLIFLLLAIIGMPKLVDNQYTITNDTKVVQQVQNANTVLINRLVQNSPASQAGFQEGDQIISIAGTKITDPAQIAEVTKSNAGKEVSIETKRGDLIYTKNVTLNAENKGDGYLGIVSESGATGREVRRYTWSAPIVAAGVTIQFTEMTLKGLWTAVSNLATGHAKTASEQVAGPVGIAFVLNEVSHIGFVFVLMVIAIISLTLAIMNILPIPALDGGRLFVMLLFKWLKKPLTPSLENKIHGTGFVALMGLFVVITIVDINRFIL